MTATAEFWFDHAMPYVESRRACRSRACYQRHSHPTFSIGAVDDGASLFTGTADGPVVLHPGTLVFVPAAHVHACNPADGAWSYQMLHLDVQWLQAVRREDARPPGACPADAAVRLTRDPAAYARFCRLNALLFSNADRQEKEAALIEFIGDCADDTAQGIEPALDALAARRRLRPMLEALRRAQMDAPLSELAGIAGVTPGRYRA